MSLRIAARIARRELRGGIKGFRIFLACLVLGVGAIAAVGTVKTGIEQGLVREGATLLGGDAEMQFTHRDANMAELDWIKTRATAQSEIVEFRSMARVGDETGLTQIKAVDGAYPLLGHAALAPDMPLSAALADQNGLPGAVMQQILIDRLGLNIGDSFRLGTQDFRLSAALVREPDTAGNSFTLGPRTIVARGALLNSGLLVPGSLFTTKYRLKLPANADLEALKSDAEKRFAHQGLRWRDKRNGTPGIQRFVERIGAFLVIVGLAGLAVGGVGVSAAVRAYLAGKTATIATLKSLGAEGRTIFQVYLIQIGVLSLLGVGLGLLFGALIPLAFAPLIKASLPIPAVFGLYPKPLAEAAIYGLLTAFVFTLWPLAKARDIRAATLFREASGQIKAWPRWPYILLTLLMLALLIWLAASFSGIPMLAYGATAGILASLGLLLLAAIALRALARRLARAHVLRGKTAIRLALGAIGGRGSEAVSVVLSLGLGLTVLAAIGQIDTNLRNAISRDLPAIAPSYFFLDIRKDQLPVFEEQLANNPQVSRVDSAPMLRGRITEINGIDAQKIAPEHWVIRGDRGITYADAMPKEAQLQSGNWWPEDYSGPPLISFAYGEAQEIGLKLGDELTVNILGRDITAKIANFRNVDFGDAGMNFVITFNAAALAAAPHTAIATVYATEQAEAPLLRDLMAKFPNITAIRVREAVAHISTILGGIAAATSYGAAATLLTGFVVLIGAAAAGEPARSYEAAILKTVGASRRTILGSFMLRSLLLGAAAGSVALLAGSIAGWAVITYVMEATYRFEPLSAIAIITGGALATLLSGLAFAWRPLSARPAQVLRARE
jgi:putative ABC transport system permease protein